MVYHRFYHYFPTIYLSYTHYVFITLVWPNWELSCLVWIDSSHKFIFEVFDTNENFSIFLLTPCFCVSLFSVFRVFKVDFCWSKSRRGLLCMPFLWLFLLLKVIIGCLRRQSWSWGIVSWFYGFHPCILGWEPCRYMVIYNYLWHAL